MGSMPTFAGGLRQCFIAALAAILGLVGLVTAPAALATSPDTIAQQFEFTVRLPAQDNDFRLPTRGPQSTEFDGIPYDWQVEVSHNDGENWESRGVAQGATSVDPEDYPGIGMLTAGDHVIRLTPVVGGDGTVPWGWLRAFSTASRPGTPNYVHQDHIIAVGDIPYRGIATSSVPQYEIASGMFQSAKNLVRVGSVLDRTRDEDWANVNAAVENRFFMSTFLGTGVSSFPDGSFDLSGLEKVGADFFYYTFFNMSQLSSLPSGSFRTDNIAATGDGFFNNTFQNTPLLTQLPDDSFGIDKIVSGGKQFFYRTFYSSGLTGLPDGSFKTGQITSADIGFFSGTFASTKLESLPEGSFDLTGFTKVGPEFFDVAFSATQLSELPVGSFDISRITKVNGASFFRYAFLSSKLKTVPEGAFLLGDIDLSEATNVLEATFGATQLDRETVIRIASQWDLTPEDLAYQNFRGVFQSTPAAGVIEAADIPALTDVTPSEMKWTFDQTNLCSMETEYPMWGLISCPAVVYVADDADSGTVPPRLRGYPTELIDIEGSGDLLRSGYTFAGWIPNGSMTTVHQGGERVAMPKEGLELRAKWEPNDSIIRYHAGTGSGTMDPTVGKVDRDSQVKHNTFTKPGYHFVEWNTVEDQSGTSVAPGSMVKLGIDGLDLYAVWAANPSVTLTYRDNGATQGQVASPVTVLSGQSVTIEGRGSLVRDGYTFLGWSEDSAATYSDSQYGVGASVVMTRDVTLFAVWGAQEASVSFDANAGGDTVTGVPGEIVGVTDEVVVVSSVVPVRDGYQFLGWTPDSAGNGSVVNAGGSYTLVPGSSILYAQWVGMRSVLTFDGNADGATGVPADVIGVTGQTVIVPGDIPTRPGHVYTGWNTRADGTGVFYQAGEDITLLGGGIILYAQWIGVSIPPVIDETSTEGTGGKGVPGSEIVVTKPGSDENLCLDLPVVVRPDGTWSCVFAESQEPGTDIEAKQIEKDKLPSDPTPGKVPGDGNGGDGDDDKSKPPVIDETSTEGTGGKGVPGSEIVVTKPGSDENLCLDLPVVVRPDGTWSCVFAESQEPGTDIEAKQIEKDKLPSDPTPGKVLGDGDGDGDGGDGDDDKSKPPVIDETSTEGTGGKGVPGSEIVVTKPGSDENLCLDLPVVVRPDGTWSCVFAESQEPGTDIEAKQIEKDKLPSDPTPGKVLGDGNGGDGDDDKSKPPVIDETTDKETGGQGVPGAEIEVTDPETGENLCKEQPVIVQPDGTWKCEFTEPQEPGTDIDVTQKEKDKEPSDPTPGKIPDRSEPPVIDETSTEGTGGKGVPGSEIVVTKPGSDENLCLDLPVVVRPDGTWSCVFAESQEPGTDIEAKQIEKDKLPSDPTPGKVPDVVDDPLRIVRYQGVDRYGTSLDLNSKRLVTGGPVFVATGANFPDSLSAGPAVTVQGGSLVLSNKGRMKPEMLNHIVAAEPSMVYIIGETAALSKEVQKQLTDRLPGKVKRVGGSDRYETSAMIAQEFFKDTELDMAFVASGANFPDALTASAAGGALKAPVLLAQGEKKATNLRPQIITFLKGRGVTELTITGGTTALGEDLVTNLGSQGFSVTRQGGVDRYGTNLLVNAMVDRKFPDTALKGVWLAAGANFPDALSAAVPAGKADQRLVLTRKSCLMAEVVDTWIFGKDSKVNFVGIVGGTSVLSSLFDEERTLRTAQCNN